MTKLETTGVRDRDASTDLKAPDLVCRGKFVVRADLEHEWYEDVEDPEAVIRAVRASGRKVDVLSFWQRLPDTTPRFNYCMERDSVAAIPITTYANWMEKQIDGKTRNMVRRAEKKGVVIRPSEFDDKFVAGMTELFNESPVRQGKPFWHYGKDFATVKHEFSRYLYREEIFGAYVGEELVGFIFLGKAGRFVELGQIISKFAHRDKAPTNALVAKAVEYCAERGIPHLAYAKWVEGSLGDFKRNNGFQKFDLPRYFVPLTLRGRLWVALKLYRGADLLPASVLKFLKNSRKKIVERRAAGAKPNAGEEKA